MVKTDSLSRTDFRTCHQLPLKLRLIVLNGFEKTKRILPVQLYPSPLYPGIQEQVNDPWLLLHQAFSWQLLFAALHSSMSAKNKPSKFKGACTRKDKHKHCKTALSVILKEFHNKVFVLLLKEYTSTANVTINTFLFWKIAANLLCINKKRAA